MKSDRIYRVDEWVTIRPLDEMNKEFDLDEDDEINMGGIYFTKEMQEYCGGSFLIIKVTYSARLLKYLYNMANADGYTFTKDMFVSQNVFNLGRFGLVPDKLFNGELL